MEAESWCPSLRSYILNTSYDKKNPIKGMITDGLKINLYFEAKNQNMSRSGGYIHNVPFLYKI